MSVNRRDFVLKAAGFSAAAFAATLSEAKPQVQPSNDALPGPDSSGIEHVVVVMQENRSFDHLLGWMPNANGVQTGLSYPNHNGEMQPTHRLTSFTGCPHPRTLLTTSPADRTARSPLAPGGMPPAVWVRPRRRIC